MQHVLPRAGTRVAGKSLELWLESSLTGLAASRHSHKGTRAGPPRPAEGRALGSVVSQRLHCPTSLAGSVFTGKGAFLFFVEELTTSMSWGSVRKILSQARTVRLAF